MVSEKATVQGKKSLSYNSTGKKVSLIQGVGHKEAAVTTLRIVAKEDI